MPQISEASIPFFQDGVDYSNFPEKLKAHYRKEHLKDIGFRDIGISAVDRYKSGVEITSWRRVELHTDLAFQEVYGKGGAKGHLQRCKSQYERDRVKVVKLNIHNIKRYKH